MNFAMKENETFFQCWERFKELLLSCPHHGYETWRVIIFFFSFFFFFFFYDGLSSNIRQFVKMMCNGEFMSKAPDEAWDYFDLLVENAQGWETTERTDKAKPEPSFRGGLYYIKAYEDMSAHIATLTRKVEAIEMSKVGVTKSPKPIEISCEICEAKVHLTKDCPTIPAFKEVLHEQANAANAYQRPFSSPYSETYNPN
jgi:hypothetical protein